MLLKDLFWSTRDRLVAVCGEYAQVETEIILETVLKKSRSQIYLAFLDNLDQVTLNEVESIVKQRLTNQPLAYILNNAYFYNRNFYITPDVLIPRPDTEILIERVRSHNFLHNCSFIDLCTGSGIIASILCGLNPSWVALAADISYKAITIAQKNRQGRLLPVCSDMLEAIQQNHQFDFIVCNPPYIAAHEFASLDPGVKNFEPLLALYGGQDGADFYRYLSIHAGNYLKPGGMLFCEIGYQQHSLVDSIFQTRHWSGQKVTTDLAGHPRVFEARAAEQKSLQ